MIEFLLSIHFDQPGWLWLFPVLVLSLVLNRNRLKYAPSEFVANITNNRRKYLHPLIWIMPENLQQQRYQLSSYVVYLLSIGFLILSLAHPFRIGQKLPDLPRERDITFIIDTSVSMSLRDYIVEGQRIDRMTLVKAVLDRFLQKLQGERISLVVFGEQAYTLVPMTTDQQLLRSMLSRIQTTMAGRFNAIGEGIALAVQQARNEPRRKRVLILVSDADQPTGKIDPLTATQMAKEAGLPLYTVAIGATTAAAEEQRVGGLIYEPVNLQLLTTISQTTGAHTYQASNVRAMDQAMADISKHTANVQQQTPRFYHESLYQWPLLAGLCLFTVYQLWQQLTFSPGKKRLK